MAPDPGSSGRPGVTPGHTPSRRLTQANDGGSSSHNRAPTRSGSGATRYKKDRKRTLSQPRFNGKIKALKGHVYDCTGGLRIGQYETTTTKIIEYVRSTFDCFGAETARAIETMTVPILEVELPPEPAEHASQDEVRLWEEEFDECYERVTCVTNNLRHVSFIMWGQCSENMRAAVMDKDRWNPRSSEDVLDPIKLLGVIKSIATAMSEHQHAASVDVDIAGVNITDNKTRNTRGAKKSIKTKELRSASNRTASAAATKVASEATNDKMASVARSKTKAASEAPAITITNEAEVASEAPAITIMNEAEVASEAPANENLDEPCNEGGEDMAKEAAKEDENKNLVHPVDPVEHEAPVDPDGEPVDPVESEAPVDPATASSARASAASRGN